MSEKGAVTTDLDQVEKEVDDLLVKLDSPKDAPAPTDVPMAPPTDVPAAPPKDAPNDTTIPPGEEKKSDAMSEKEAVTTDLDQVEKEVDDLLVKLESPKDAPMAPPTDVPVVPPTDAPVVLPKDVPVARPTDAPVVAPRTDDGGAVGDPLIEDEIIELVEEIEKYYEEMGAAAAPPEEIIKGLEMMQGIKDEVKEMQELKQAVEAVESSDRGSLRGSSEITEPEKRNGKRV
jgi:hypothetical protein